MEDAVASTDAEHQEPGPVQAFVPKPWYTQDEVRQWLGTFEPNLSEFSEFITDHFNNAFRKGYEIGVRAEREECAKLMEGDVQGQRRDNQFCRLADHMQGSCECEERAEAIRQRK